MSTAITTNPILDRLARAAQDSVTVFGPTITIAPGITEAAILHSPGPATQKELSDARRAVADEAKRLWSADTGACLTFLRDAADIEHARWAQYVGAFDQTSAQLATRRRTFKGGLKVEPGDVLLVTDRGEDGISAFVAHMGHVCGGLR